jgi:hypothetical protein
MRHDPKRDMLAAIALVHEASVEARFLVEDTKRRLLVPDALAPLLKALAGATTLVRTAYAPSDDPNEHQPVAFDDRNSGWDFDPWMNEKITAMDNAARYSLREWQLIAEAIGSGKHLWLDYLSEFDPSNLGDTPVNRLSYFEYCLSEVESKAKSVFEVLSGRLIAQSPGRP